MTPDEMHTRFWKEVNGTICYEEFAIVQRNEDTFDLIYTTDNGELNRRVTLVASSDESLVKYHYDASLRTAIRKGWKEVPYLNKDDTNKDT